MERRVGVCRGGGPALLAVIAAGALGCGDALGLYYPTTSGAVEVVAASVTPAASGGSTIDATLKLTLASYEEGDEVALDAVSLALGGDPVIIDAVAVDDGDWPVELEAEEPTSRTLRVTGHVDQLPWGTEGLCAASLAVNVTVGLLVGSGEVTALGTGELQFAPSGPRLGLARAGSEAPLSFDASFGTVATTIDEEGTTWMLVSSGYAGEAHLVTRRRSGEIEEEALPVFSATMAAAPGGGVVLAESFVGTVEVSLRRGVGDVAWTRTVVAPASSMESLARVATHPGGVTIAVYAGAGVSVDDLKGGATSGSLLVDLDLEGRPLGVGPVPRPGQEPTGVMGLAWIDDALVVASPTALFALRGDEVIWSRPFPTYVMAVGDGRIAASGDLGVAMFDASSGAQIWVRPGEEMWVPDSMAIREGGELLLATSIGNVARWAADGAVLFDGQVVCSQPVAVGSAAGRVAYASIALGREGWGDAPDREVVSPLLTLGEVLP